MKTIVIERRCYKHEINAFGADDDAAEAALRRRGSLPVPRALTPDEV